MEEISREELTVYKMSSILCIVYRICACFMQSWEEDGLDGLISMTACTHKC